VFAAIPYFMTLSAGSTLNNGKYTIDEMMHQTDFGVIYRATHTYLEQPVTIQTFNDCVLLRGDYEQWRQLFLAEARRRASLAGEQPYKILDCFEEANVPFVVMQQEPGQVLPKIQDWLPLMKPVTVDPSWAESSADPLTGSKPRPPMASRQPAPPTAIAADPRKKDPAAEALQPAPPVQAVKPTSELQASPTAAEHGKLPAETLPAETVSFQVQPSQPMHRSDFLSVSLPGMKAGAGAPDVSAAPATPLSTHTTAASPAPANIPANPPLANTTADNTVPVHPTSADANPTHTASATRLVTQGVGEQLAKSSQRPRFRQVLPIALTLTAIAGGLAGAAFGWLVRFEDTPPAGAEDASLFNFKNDQTFPPVQAWPITETTGNFAPIGEETDSTTDSSADATNGTESDVRTDANSEANFYREAPVRTIRQRSRSDNPPPSERSVIRDEPAPEIAPIVEPESLTEPKLEPEAIVPDYSEPSMPLLEEQPPKLIEPPAELAPPPAPVEVPEVPIRKPVPQIAPEPAPSESAPIADFDTVPQ